MITNPPRLSPKPPATAPAFTLIEILVTVAIIITLATLGVFVAKNAQTKAQQTKSISAMRGVAVANMQYSADNNAQINTMRWVGDREEGKPFVGNSFWGRLTPHLFPSITTTNQPQLKREIKQQLERHFSARNADTMEGTWLEGSKIYHDGSGLPVPFAFNKELYKWNKWVRTSQVTDVSQIMYFAYGFGVYDEDDGKEFTPRPTDNSKPDNNIYYLDSGKAMVSFLDGHVEMLPPPIPGHMWDGKHD